MEHDVRVCAVQFNPVLFEPERNMEKAEELLFSRVKPSSVDFVVFPEMAFTGYEFRSKQEVLPYCEQQRGRTYNFCSSISKRLEACVVAGYPERCVGADGENVLYNSMCIVDQHGDLVGTYRKRFLYETDKTWAEDGGEEFQSYEILGLKVAFGICMDINPKEFDYANDTFALASFCKKRDVDILLFSTNWILNDGEEENPGHLHGYWAWRLTPLIGKRCLFVAANRTGVDTLVNFKQTRRTHDTEDSRLKHQQVSREERHSPERAVLCRWRDQA
mmetsp:Transcript_34299/g.134519  ORF Transcript_34299/g.134519 Transcript_34299/m.134519 type:complete len:275 (-) Transcript_34299:1772-2596(-)